MDNDLSPQNPIAFAIDSAQPVNKAGEPDHFGNRRIANYRIENGRVEYLKPARDQSQRGKSDGDSPHMIEVPVAITLNFIALIVEEVLLDDGLELKAAFIVEGRLQDGRPLPQVTVPASQFAGMGWIMPSWGTRAILAPGTTTKEHHRAAMQLLSGNVPRKTVFQHTGWRLINGHWAYLSGSGAIGEHGLDASVHVELDAGHMRLYALPAPPSHPLHVAGRLLDLLHIAPKNPAVGAALFCAIVRAPLAECHPIDFSLFFAGRSGSQKSEIAALALGCFGPFSARTLPANFTDTESDLEIKAHQAKDTVFVVDDFAPSTNQVEASRLHAKTERLFRSVGNQAGRGRRNSDLTGRPAYHPRGLVIATGEDVPRGASLLGRLLIISIQRGDVNLDTLSGFQQAAREHRLADMMSAYVQWLAPHMADLKRDLPKRIIEHRDQALKDGFAASHPRACDLYASLYAGAELYLQYIAEVKALPELDAASTLDAIDMHLRDAIKAQGDYQRQTDEVERFKDLLRACFASREVHVNNHLTQGKPETCPHTWGWSVVDTKDETIRTPCGDGEIREMPVKVDVYAPCGSRIGYINEADNELWLIPDNAYRAVQRFSSQQNESFLISQATLWKRLQERGELLASEKDAKTGTMRPAVKKSIGGRRERLLVFPAAIITDSDI